VRADVFTTEQRSAVMRAVKSRDTAPERAVRAAVRALGYARRYRLNGAHLPGRPDLVFPRFRKAVFVHGCFWHGHDCKRGARQPKDNAQYWRAKILRNRMRDKRALVSLRTMGWTALVIWECETRNPETLSRRIEAFLKRRPPVRRRRAETARSQRQAPRSQK
jgi:DNA mismatch endonuclease (patch repair protein)